ncbi:hypothetical protein DSO57_1031006 [Entomophthora muscae]|uniref:Uncharacterized protein n=1 Tax=Entomophthora muscae TaxID=34485 RepID=A0ACC2SQ71_9FUNG|nr:hypothetical protein DSO57_1031006 [Entomophthora muscae]
MHLALQVSLNGRVSRRDVDAGATDCRVQVAMILLVFIVLVLVVVWLTPLLRAWLHGNKEMLSDTTLSQIESYRAWHVSNSRALVLKRSNMHFLREARVQTKIPVPDDRDFYFEVMPLTIKPGATILIGAGPQDCARDYPQDFLFDIITGAIQANGVILDRLPSTISPEGSIIGCLITCWPKPSITFSRNGQFSRRIDLPYPSPLHPTILSSASCSFSTNFGYSEFLYFPTSEPPPRYSIAVPQHAITRNN